MNTRRNRRGPDTEIVVVGAGIVGASTALALARSGFAVQLVEAAPPQPWSAAEEPDLRVVALAPSARDLLQQLGVWDDVAHARVSPFRRMHVEDAASGAGVDFAAASGHAQLGWIVENRLLQDRLWQALPAAGVDCHCPARVVALGQADEEVALDLEGGASLRSRIVVAADGGNSPVREMAGIEAGGRDYHQRAVVAHVLSERPHDAVARQRFLAGGPLAFLPLQDGRCSIVWSLPEGQAREVLALDDEAFCRALGAASDFMLGRILETTPRAAFPLKLQLARRYRAGRLVLCGDAAHVVHPLAGQGVNLGLRDVVELRSVLTEARDAGRDIGSAPVLQRYARRRRSAAARDAWSFDALERVFAWQSAPLVAARGAGMALLKRLPPLRAVLAGHAAGRKSG